MTFVKFTNEKITCDIFTLQKQDKRKRGQQNDTQNSNHNNHSNDNDQKIL